MICNAISVRCPSFLSLVKAALALGCITQLLGCARQRRDSHETATSVVKKSIALPNEGSRVSTKIPSDIFPAPEEPVEPAPGAWRAEWMVVVSAERRRGWAMPDGIWELEMPGGEWRCVVSHVRAEFHSVSQEREESARRADETCPDPERRRARGVGTTEAQCRSLHAASALLDDVGLGDRYWTISRELACSADVWKTFVRASASFNVDETGKLPQLPEEEVLYLMYGAGSESVTVYLIGPANLRGRSE